MSISARAMTKGKAGAAFHPALAFQRGGGEQHSRKVRRHFALRHGHILSLLLLQAAMFIVLHEAWLYLLTWDRLNVTDVKVVCAHPILSREVSQALSLRPLGNILLCDVRKIQEDVESFAWVREARVTRLYPSTLRVDVRERRPAARLARSAPRMIDREGIDLGTPVSEAQARLPLLIDRGDFRFGLEDKLEAAWAFLDALPEYERDGVEALDLTDTAAPVVKFRDDPVLVKVVTAGAVESLHLFRERRMDWENRFGPLQSVDLRFEGRAVLKPAGTRGPAAETRRLQFSKEAD